MYFAKYHTRRRAHETSRYVSLYMYYWSLLSLIWKFYLNRSVSYHDHMRGVANINDSIVPEYQWRGAETSACHSTQAARFLDEPTPAIINTALWTMLVAMGCHQVGVTCNSRMFSRHSCYLSIYLPFIYFFIIQLYSILCLFGGIWHVHIHTASCDIVWLRPCDGNITE